MEAPPKPRQIKSFFPLAFDSGSKIIFFQELIKVMFKKKSPKTDQKGVPLESIEFHNLKSIRHKYLNIDFFIFLSNF